ELEELVSRVGEADIGPGEPESLARERERLRHLDELTAALDGAAALINPEEGEGALTLTSRSAELVRGAERVHPGLGEVAGELGDAAVRLQEAAIELRAQLDGLEAEPGRLEHVEGRLQLFADLERRFGTSVAELAAGCAEAQAALELIDGGG